MIYISVAPSLSITSHFHVNRVAIDLDVCLAQPVTCGLSTGSPCALLASLSPLCSLTTDYPSDEYLFAECSC